MEVDVPDAEFGEQGRQGDAEDDSRAPVFHKPFPVPVRSGRLVPFRVNGEECGAFRPDAPRLSRFAARSSGRKSNLGYDSSACGCRM